jgi:hypothetical protein
VIDELARRGTAIVAGEAVRLGRAYGLSRQQIIGAGEEATATLAMRLRQPLHLKLITALARELAEDAIRARKPETDRPPRLASRPPELREVGQEPPPAADKKAVPQKAVPPAARSIDAQLADALRRGRIKRNKPETS